MSLDTVELVMEIEESFGIRIADSEAEKIQTAGQAFECILSKLPKLPAVPGECDTRCASSSAFYKIRRAMIETGGAARRIVRPATPLSTLVPEQKRGEVWERLDATLGLRLPSLRRPEWLVNCCIGFALITAVLVALPLSLFHLGVAALSIPCTLAFLAIVLASGTSRFAAELPFGTVAELVGVVVASNYSALNAPHEPDEVWFALQRIISEQLGVPLALVTKDASFVEDLGCD